MSFVTCFYERNAYSPILINCQVSPLWASWSAFGGPKEALLRLTGSPNNLFELANFLRIPVEIKDQQDDNVWWGYVDTITIHYEGSIISLTLDDLFNKVKVDYSFISPDNKLADQLETAYAEDTASQAEYGTKELIIQKFNLDQDFAEHFRDTFLATHSTPQHILSQQDESPRTFAELHCSGWFSTLAWKSYDTAAGFYANYGPGPGSFAYGNAANRIYPAQSFTTVGSSALKYAYFMLRKFGTPSGNSYVSLLSDAAVSPSALVANSANVSEATIADTGYSWYAYEFSTPVALTAATRYWLALTHSAVSGTHYLSVRLDENMTMIGEQGKYYNGASWVNLPTVTNPGGVPDLYFRAVCVSDTGLQIGTIATAAMQFSAGVQTISSGINACPYRDNSRSALEEILELMQLGTSNDRLILANVLPNVYLLDFYEQPDPNTPTVFMDQQGRFFDHSAQPIKPYKPPVGEFAYFLGSSYFSQPFDKARVPACFVGHALFDFKTGKLSINPG